MRIDPKGKQTMKDNLLLIAMKKGAKRMPVGLGLALAATLLQHNATAQEVNLATANNFAVLAGSGITSTGATTVNGDIGTYPTTTYTLGSGFTLNGVNETSDTGMMLTAKNDLTTAYNTAAGLAPTATLTGLVLGVGAAQTLTPGVYFFASSAQLTGTLTLNGEGLADPVFVFQIGSTLTTASGSSVVTVNDDGSTTPGISVFWQVGTSATLGTTTAFEGNILAGMSITANTGATDLDGRLLAEAGAVTLDANTITAPPAEVAGSGPGSGVPDTGSTLLLLGSALATLLACGRRRSALPRQAA
jgi:hypothetical protein